jgi:hypothetical protein
VSAENFYSSKNASFGQPIKIIYVGQLGQLIGLPIFPLNKSPLNNFTLEILIANYIY